MRIDISDKKAAEEAIQASEEKFRLVFDSIGQGILIHRNRKPLYANKALADMYGFASLNDLLALESTAVLTAPEYLTDRHFRRIAGEALPYDDELKGIRADGSEFWIDKRSFRIVWNGEPAMCSICHDITERKQAEDAIRASEERFRTLIDSCNLGIVVHRDGKQLYANQAFAKIYGFNSPDEIIALQDNGALIPPGTHRNFTSKKVNKNNFNNLTFDDECQALRKDGSTFWISKRSFGILWDNEPAICSFRADITQRKKAENALRENENQFRTFTDQLPMAINIRDSDCRFVHVNKRVEEWNDLKREDFIGKTHEEVYGTSLKNRSKIIKSQIKDVNETGRPTIGVFRRTLADGRIIDCEVSKFPIFDDAGKIIQIGSISTDITERIEAENSLRLSELRFRGAVESIQDGFALYDADDRLVNCNDEYLRLHPNSQDLMKPGMRFEEMIRHNVFSGINANAIGREEEHIKKRMEQHRNPKGPIIRELTNGTWFIINESRTPDGGYSVTETDITQLKQAEVLIRNSEERFRGAIKSLQERFALYGADDRLIICNDGYKNFHPTSRGMIKPGMLFEDRFREFVGSGAITAAIGQEEAHIKKRMEQHRNPKGPFIRELANGTCYIISESRTPEGGYCITETDITDLKKTETALRDSEERFRTLFNSAPQGIMVHRHRKALYANQAFAEMHGYDSPDDILALENTIGLLMPEYQRDHHERRLQGEKFEPDDECVGLRQDGTQFWLEKRTFLINWGGELAACTIRTDIDQRKKTEDALRESEVRFRTLFNTSPQGILVHRNHKPLYANPALAEMYGYESPDDILNMKSTQRLIVPGFERPLTDALALEKGESFDREYRGLRKNGEEFWVQKRSFAINWNGELALCSMRTDITEHKEAAEIIRRSEDRFRLAIAGLQEGFGLYDADDHLVVYNDEFVRLHPGAKDIIRPGLKWEELLSKTIESGQNALALGREAAYRQKRTEQHKNPTGPILLHNTDGTWRIVNETRLPDGGTAVVQTDITALKKLEAEATSAQTQLLAAIESIEGGFTLYGSDGRLVLSNSNNKKYFEDVSDLYQPGVHFKEILQARAARGLIDGIDGKIEDWVEDRIKRFQRRKPSVHLRQDRGRWMQINEYPTSDGGKAIIRTDITDSKVMMDALRESEERFKILVDSSNQGIIIHRNNKPLYANAALAGMFGYKSPKEVMAISSTKKLFPPAKKPKGQHNIGLTTNEDESLTAKKDGTPVWVYNRSFNIDWEGKPSLCTTLFDITIRKTAETQLIQASKLASLGELASSVAHELNQPLSITRIVAESTMMKAEENTLENDYLQKQLGAICDQAERMANITNHLRMFSRLDEGDVSLFDPTESLTNAINLIEQPFRLSGIKLTKHLPKHPSPVLGSGFKLEQVILNLLNNAADAVNEQLDRKEDAGENYTPRISVSLSDNNKSKEITIRVRDNGGGVSKEYLEKVFDPFFTTKLAEQGTGLGLSISFGIVKSMQGTLSVANDKHGALFTIKLPAQPAAKVLKNTKIETPKSVRQKKLQNGKNKGNGNGQIKQNGNGAAHHILVVDDEPLAAESIAEHLEFFGYSVQTAQNGAEALSICDNGLPDVVITDLRMPVMDGFELIRELKNLHPQLPIIVTTGHANLEEEEEEAVTDGASAVLWKPIRLKDLTQKLT